MTLLNKNRLKNNISDTEIFKRQNEIAENTPVNLTKTSAKDRRPVQVNPEAKEFIQRIAYAKNIPMYAVIDDAIRFYKQYGITDVERERFDKYVTPKTGKLKK